MGTPKQDSATVSNSVKKPYGKIVLTLKNCLLPDEKLVPTPSQLDGLDAETETDLRILGCELIQTAGILLKLPQVAMATGQVLFQRFYYSTSFVRHAMETTAMGCICLASKIEEAPRRIRDVINVFHHIKQVKGQKTIQPMILDQNYIALKTQVIKAERRVLKELGFCVHVKHPHKLIVMYLQVLCFEKHQTLMQLAWNYMNDSLRTDVFVRYQPETVACACIYLTSRRLGIPLPKSPAWYSLFRVEEKDIQDVCMRILRLYARKKPNSEELERRVEELRKQYQEARLKARGTNSTGTGGGAGSNSPGSPSRARHTSPRWGGFISRNNHNSEKHRSRSRTRSPSHSPPPSKHSKKSKKTSRSNHSSDKHRSRSRTRSPSHSPPPVKHKKSKASREKTRHRSRSRSHESRRGENYDRYYSSGKSRSRHSSRGVEDRPKERR
ncbi:cyclin-L1 isoform X3 [Schistocerca nitens]|uniref:cyclin-L1 isoform X3 n=1 Tax=Schistocerca cancellata TaxID=274614 RepID=UPI0021181739|nr:cyclin-L1 isoform X3 [Schistocerca cancellata]XP_049811088.1 cyclin-L1 isoform X3 [Schistocerca nitens]XP_049862208.1 cyclin-L1 isoform X3 [Schistocerca gregaria]